MSWVITLFVWMLLATYKCCCNLCNLVNNNFSSTPLGTDLTIVSGTWLYDATEDRIQALSDNALVITTSAATTGNQGGSLHAEVAASEPGVVTRLYGARIDEGNHVVANILWDTPKSQVNIYEVIENVATLISASSIFTDYFVPGAGAVPVFLCWDDHSVTLGREEFIPDGGPWLCYGIKQPSPFTPSIGEKVGFGADTGATGVAYFSSIRMRDKSVTACTACHPCPALCIEHTLPLQVQLDFSGPFGNLGGCPCNTLPTTVIADVYPKNIEPSNCAYAYDFGQMVCLDTYDFYDIVATFNPTGAGIIFYYGGVADGYSSGGGLTAPFNCLTSFPAMPRIGVGSSLCVHPAFVNWTPLL